MRTLAPRFTSCLVADGRARGTAIKLRDEMRGWQLSEPPFEFGYLLPPHHGPLPRGEGASSSVARVACAPRLIAAWQMVLPRPEGEGRREGKRCSDKPMLSLMAVTLALPGQLRG